MPLDLLRPHLAQQPLEEHPEPPEVVSDRERLPWLVDRQPLEVNSVMPLAVSEASHQDSRRHPVERILGELVRASSPSWRPDRWSSQDCRLPNWEVAYRPFACSALHQVECFHVPPRHWAERPMAPPGASGHLMPPALPESTTRNQSPHRRQGRLQSNTRRLVA